MDLTGIWGALGGASLLAAAVTGFWAWKATRPSTSKDAADLVNAAATFQAALQKAAEQVVADLRREVEELRHRVRELESDNERCRRESELLRQGGRQLEQRIASLMSTLRRSGVDLPADDLTSVMVELNPEDDTVTVLKVPRAARSTTG